MSRRILLLFPCFDAGFVLLRDESLALPFFPALPPELRQYLALTDAQADAVTKLFNENQLLASEKSRRMAQVQSEIAEELNKDPLDPMSIGVRYAEIEAIRRGLDAESERHARCRARRVDGAAESEVENVGRSQQIEFDDLIGRMLRISGPNFVCDSAPWSEFHKCTDWHTHFVVCWGIFRMRLFSNGHFHARSGRPADAEITRRSSWTKKLSSTNPHHQDGDTELPVLPDAGHLRTALAAADQEGPAALAVPDERDRARFQKAQSYMVLLDDKAMCKNMRCRKRFDISGVKTMAFV